MRKLSTALALTLLAIAAVVVSGCGGGSDSGGGTKGGEVTILDTAGGVDSLDPGYWYYQTDYTELGQTTQRWLYSWKPDDTKPSPDLATGAPKLSNGGKTITIKIKSGIKYSPPLQNRTVK